MKLLLLISIFLISFNCFATNKTAGTWNFLETIENPNPDFGNQPFPESVVIKFTGDSEGTLTVKIPAQAEPKTYLFSNTMLKNSETIQKYYEGTDNPYAHKEEATTSYSKDVFDIQLTWTELTCAEWRNLFQHTLVHSTCPKTTDEDLNLDEDKVQAPTKAKSSYTFFLKGAELHFTRVNSKGMVFKASYSLQE